MDDKKCSNLYALLKIESGTEDYRYFHEIQRADLLRIAENDYDPSSYDAFFLVPAERHQLLLKYNRAAIGVLTFDKIDGHKAVLRGIAIKEEFRNCGHGRALIEAARDYAADRGVTQLCVNANVDKTPFYRRLFFIETEWSHAEATLMSGEGAPVQMVLHL